MADKNCKETPFADQHENNYMELQRCGYQEKETATGADAVDGDVDIKITPESRKRCLRAVAFVAVVMVLVMTTAAFALAVLNYKNSRSGELTDKVNQLANESQRVETELTNEFNFLSSQLNQLRNETKIAEEELKSEYNIINGQLDQLRNETKLVEEELKSEYNIINGQLDQLRNETKLVEEELKSEYNIINGQLDQLRNESQETERELTNEFNFLSSQLNQLRNETKIAEEEQKSEYNIINGQLDQLRNETKLVEEELKSEYNIINGQLDQLRNESLETERELTNDINLSLSSTRDNISQVVANLNTIMTYLLYYDQGRPNCGAGLWYRVAFLNMSDPSQQCPSAWRLVTTNGVRACGRPASSGSSCPGTFYSATIEYQRVCGRVIGYQDESPDGFLNADRSINDIYMDGVSITYGQPRNHIWSYVGGVTETSIPHTVNNCPCSNASGTGPQSFVGDNYYCESGNPTDTYSSFYSDDKLWDGKQCEGTCCTDSKSPPWFSVRLPNPTTESIEVRICGDEGTSNEDTPIELLEIYVQ